ELFDYAFKVYCQRWQFKHPTPADFFRTMEDASAVDLDWFWRGWFYTTDHCDIALDEVRHFELNTKNPDIEKTLNKENEAKKDQFIGDIRNKESIKETADERDPSLNDFYATYDPNTIDELDRKEYQDFEAKLSEEDKAFLLAGNHYYELKFKN